MASETPLLSPRDDIIYSTADCYSASTPNSPSGTTSGFMTPEVATVDSPSPTDATGPLPMTPSGLSEDPQSSDSSSSSWTIPYDPYERFFRVHPEYERAWSPEPEDRPFSVNAERVLDDKENVDMMPLQPTSVVPRGDLDERYYDELERLSEQLAASMNSAAESDESGNASLLRNDRWLQRYNFQESYTDYLHKRPHAPKMPSQFNPVREQCPGKIIDFVHHLIPAGSVFRREYVEDENKKPESMVLNASTSEHQGVVGPNREQIESGWVRNGIGLKLLAVKQPHSSRSKDKHKARTHATQSQSSVTVAQAFEIPPPPLSFYMPRRYWDSSEVAQPEYVDTTPTFGLGLYSVEVAPTQLPPPAPTFYDYMAENPYYYLGPPASDFFTTSQVDPIPTAYAPTDADHTESLAENLQTPSALDAPQTEVESESQQITIELYIPEQVLFFIAALVLCIVVLVCAGFAIWGVWVLATLLLKSSLATQSIVLTSLFSGALVLSPAPHSGNDSARRRRHARGSRATRRSGFD
ncbi:hypothetical protein AX16_010207 [Volvariella volvacea WC 439]|nr:hypothetical protein AX16_010207 [Volvariella volvacea WC 439]